MSSWRLRRFVVACCPCPTGLPSRGQVDALAEMCHGPQDVCVVVEVLALATPALCRLQLLRPLQSMSRGPRASATPPFCLILADVHPKAARTAQWSDRMSTCVFRVWPLVVTLTAHAAPCCQGVYGMTRRRPCHPKHLVVKSSGLSRLAARCIPWADGAGGVHEFGGVGAGRPAATSSLAAVRCSWSGRAACVEALGGTCVGQYGIYLSARCRRRCCHRSR